MTPEARRYIRLAREEYSPSDADKRRVQRALGVGRAATAAVETVSSPEAAAAAKAVGILGAGAGLRGAVGLLLVASAGAGAYLWTRGPSATPPSPAPMVTQAAPAALPAPPADQPSPATETSSEAVPQAAPLPHHDGQKRSAHAPEPLVGALTVLHPAQHAWRD